MELRFSDNDGIRGGFARRAGIPTWSLPVGLLLFVQLGCDRLKLPEEPPAPPQQGVRVTPDEPEPEVAAEPAPPPATVEPPPVVPKPMPPKVTPPTFAWAAKSYRGLQNQAGRGLLFDLKINIESNPDEVPLRFKLRDAASNEIVLEPRKVGNTVGIEHFVPGANVQFAPYYIAIDYYDAEQDVWQVLVNPALIEP